MAGNAQHVDFQGYTRVATGRTAERERNAAPVPLMASEALIERPGPLLSDLDAAAVLVGEC
jgi:hypothetical protein